jgi:hypothetical protein
VSLVMSSLEKSAIPDAPLATTPPAQFEATLHDALPRKLHEPLAAVTVLAKASDALAAAIAGMILRIRCRCRRLLFLLMMLCIFRPSLSLG